MSQSNYVVDTLISAKSIAARIELLAKEIELEFKETDNLIVVGLLRGSFVFIADLVRELNLPVEVDFLEASSYGNEMVSSKEVRILKDLRGAIEGKDVLLVEDIVDTGFTLHHVSNLLLSRSPAKLKTIALGGINEKNIARTRFTRSYGIASISFIKNNVKLGKFKTLFYGD